MSSSHYFVGVSVQSIYSELITGNFSIEDKSQKGKVSISLYKCLCLLSTGVLLKLLVAGQGNIYWDTKYPDLNCNVVLQWAINSLLYFLKLKKKRQNKTNPQLWNVLIRFYLNSDKKMDAVWVAMVLFLELIRNNIAQSS